MVHAATEIDDAHDLSGAGAAQGRAQVVEAVQRSAAQTDEDVAVAEAGARGRAPRHDVGQGHTVPAAARVGARFVTVVLEDGSYSLIKLAQENRKLEPYRMDFGPIDTVKMAEACGVAAVRTTKPAELADAAASALADRRNLVIAVPVDYSDYRQLF